MPTTPERQATWRITDTLAVQVTVLNLTEDGRAFIRAASGTKWVPASELDLGARA